MVLSWKRVFRLGIVADGQELNDTQTNQKNRSPNSILPGRLSMWDGTKPLRRPGGLAHPAMRSLTPL